MGPAAAVAGPFFKIQSKRLFPYKKLSIMKVLGAIRKGDHQMAATRTYIAIDLKSFYASAECAALGLDPLNVNLVVADQSRTDKTICLAVSPALKKFGLPGRPRLFQVEQAVAELNRDRTLQAHHRLRRKSVYRDQLLRDPTLAVSYRVVVPRMAYYLQVSNQIYQIYLKYVAADQIHVYSIDEVFMDVTAYLKLYQTTAHDLAKRIIQEVQRQTGITATAGIGSNLYLAKVAMDIVAKKIPADQDGVRIAKLTELSYRKYLWAHTPLTDFWRIGKGYAQRLEKMGLYTMGDIARQSLGTLSDARNEEQLYQEFGRVAELIIDHAWGYEPTTIHDIKAYRPSDHSIGSGQVLATPYPFAKAKIVTREMIDALALDLVKQHQVCDQVVLHVAYDVTSLATADASGAVTTDFYGRRVPKAAHGSASLPVPTASTQQLRQAVLRLFEAKVNRHYQVRKLTVTVNHVVTERQAAARDHGEQLDLFQSPQVEQRVAQETAAQRRERQAQEAILKIQEKFGKNALFWAADLQPGATLLKRNQEIGGHRS